MTGSEINNREWKVTGAIKNRFDRFTREYSSSRGSYTSAEMIIHINSLTFLFTFIKNMHMKYRKNVMFCPISALRRKWGE